MRVVVACVLVAVLFVASVCASSGAIVKDSYSSNNVYSLRQTGCETSCCDYTGSRTLPLSVSYQMDWTVNCSTSTITVTLTVETTGWIGWGVGSDGSMVNTDMVQANIVGGTVNLADRWATGQAQPRLDTIQGGTNNVVSLGGSEQSGVTQVSFRRPLDSGEATDYPITNAPVTLFFAFCTEDTLAIGHTDRDTITIEFMGSSTPSTTGTTGTPSSSTTGSSECTDITQTASFLGGDSTVEWTVDCAAQSITFTVVTKTTGWTGIGFGPDGSMRDTDIVMGTVDGNGIATITDRYATSQSTPAIDAQDDLTDTSGTESDGVTTIKFTRLMNTGDARDYDLSPGRTTFLLVAYSTSDDTSQVHLRKEAASIDFYTGSVSTVSSTNYRAIHGVLMMIAWGICAGLGQLLARYLKNIGHLWFVMHRLLNYLAVFATFAGFVIIVYSMDTFVASAHHILGLFILAGTLAQPILGTIADKKFKPGRAKAPFFPDMLHWWLGRLVILAAFANMGLGFCEYRAHSAIWALYGVLLGVYISAIVYLEIRQGQVSHNDSEGVEMSDMQSQSSGVLSVVYVPPASGCWQNNKKSLVPFYLLSAVGTGLVVAICVLLFELDPEGSCAIARA